MLHYFRNLVTMRRDDDDRGASAVEYGLLVAGIAAVIVVLVMTLGGRIHDSFQKTCDSIQVSGNANDTGSCDDGE